MADFKKLYEDIMMAALPTGENGTPVAGLAASNDYVTTERAKVPVFQETVQGVPVTRKTLEEKVVYVPRALANSIALWSPVDDPDEEQLGMMVNGLAYLYGSKHLNTTDTYRVIKDTMMTDEQEAKGIKLFETHASRETMARVITVMNACKVSHRVTNHHTQSPNVHRAIAVLWGLGTGVSVSKSTVSIFHALSHCMNTRAWTFANDLYKGFVIPVTARDLRLTRSMREAKFAELAEDLRLRADGNPAGTAKVMDTHAAAVKAAISPFGSPCLTDPELTTLCQCAAAVKACPTVFAIAGPHLLGDRKAEATRLPVLDAVRYDMSVFVHAVYSGSTLARAPSLYDAMEVSADPRYMSIVAAKRAMMKMRKKQIADLAKKVKTDFTAAESLEKRTGVKMPASGGTTNFAEILQKMYDNNQLQRDDADANPAAPGASPTPEEAAAAARAERLKKRAEKRARLAQEAEEEDDQAASEDDAVADEDAEAEDDDDGDDEADEDEEDDDDSSGSSSAGSGPDDDSSSGDSDDDGGGASGAAGGGGGAAAGGGGGKGADKVPSTERTSAAAADPAAKPVAGSATQKKKEKKKASTAGSVQGGGGGAEASKPMKSKSSDIDPLIRPAGPPAKAESTASTPTGRKSKAAGTIASMFAASSKKKKT
eukprot:GHVU01162453.1.p1 GENE.GHVU01162453.1~~GHVU01162453.1.p1  ORF type:complete len:655 (+),score=154.94 GHVU01162453.1:12-1976(+)